MDRGIRRWETFQGGQVKVGFGQLRGFSRAASAFEGGHYLDRQTLSQTLDCTDRRREERRSKARAGGAQLGSWLRLRGEKVAGSVDSRLQALRVSRDRRVIGLQLHWRLW